MAAQSGDETVPVGPAYAVWTGIGVTGAMLAGMLWLGEAVTLGRLTGLALILAGLACLKAG